MPYNLELKYAVTSIDDTSAGFDDVPKIKMLIVQNSKVFKIGDFTLSELRLLTGASNEYRLIEAMTQGGNDTGRDYPVVTDNSIDNETFVRWAQGFPDSIFTPILQGQFPREPK